MRPARLAAALALFALASLSAHAQTFPARTITVMGVISTNRSKMALIISVLRCDWLRLFRLIISLIHPNSD